jgi:hypothetical protein
MPVLFECAEESNLSSVRIGKVKLVIEQFVFRTPHPITEFQGDAISVVASVGCQRQIARDCANERSKILIDDAGAWGRGLCRTAAIARRNSPEMRSSLRRCAPVDLGKAFHRRYLLNPTSESFGHEQDLPWNPRMLFQITTRAPRNMHCRHGTRRLRPTGQSRRYP